MILRPASPADIPALRAMLQALSDHDGRSEPVGSEQSLAAAAFGPRPLVHAVMACDPAPVGMAIYYPDYSTHRGEPGVYVQDVYVAPAARGAGLGRALLAETMRQQSWGASYLTLGVSPDNIAANRLYQRLGFRHRGYDFLILDGAGLKALTAP